MDSGDINLLAQLIESMEEATKRLQQYYRNREVKKFKKVKKEVLNFQRQIDSILKRNS